MSVYKRGKYFCYDFIFHGRRVQMSTGLTDRDMAVRAEERHRNCLARLRLVHLHSKVNPRGPQEPKSQERLQAERIRYEVQRHDRTWKLAFIFPPGTTLDLGEIRRHLSAYENEQVELSIEPEKSGLIRRRP